MIIGDAFPSVPLPRRVKQIWIDWSSDADCRKVSEILCLAFNETQIRQEDVERFANLAIEDLMSLKVSEATFVDVFHLLQFDLSAGMMGIGASSKQFPLLWTWTIRSIFDGPIESRVDFDAAERIHTLRLSRRQVVQELFSQTFFEWAAPFYYGARRMGQWTELAQMLFSVTTTTALEALPAPDALEALRMALNWDAMTPPLRGTAVMGDLNEKYRGAKFPPWAQARIGVLFAGKVGETHGLRVLDEAQHVLSEYGSFLQAHERLQIIATIAGETFQRLAEMKSQVLDAIREYNAWLDQGGSWDIRKLYDKGPLFETLLRLLYKAFQANQQTVALELIAAWKDLPRAALLAGTQMIFLPSYPTGIAVSTPAGFRTVTSPEAIRDYRDLVEVTNSALGTTINVPTDPAFKLADPDRFGHPDPSYGNEFQARLESFYFPAALGDFVLDAHGADGVALLPYIGHPIQALLQKKLGTGLPYCVSWRSPSPDRPIRRALILANEVLTADLELRELRRILDTAGIESVVIVASSGTKEAFLGHATSNEFDLIWVISHGEYNQYIPHQSFIPVQGASALDLHDLAFLPAEPEERRLVVLNICSGGSAATLGGLPDLGISSVLVAHNQAVISHLWPVSLWPPVAFAAILATWLVRGTGYFQAFEAAMSRYGGGRDSVFEGLRESEASSEFIDRIDQANVDWNNILVWGSPVFLQ